MSPLLDPTVSKLNKLKRPAASLSDEATVFTAVGQHLYTNASTSPTSKKRKRENKALEEIEVDINLPEPPSKKALRKAKQGKANTTAPIPKVALDSDDEDDDEDDDEATPSQAIKRSEFGIWIGNIPWTASKIDIEKFLVNNGKIDEETITRINMPGPTQKTLETWRQKIKPLNRGFAYVDFSSLDTLALVLPLSETLLSGRRVLIKDAKNFDGRPRPTKGEEGAGTWGNPLSKKIFVGNLAFDTSQDELREHFQRCGDVESVFVATFEDSGKCKGYGWIQFQESGAAEKAIRGWVKMDDGVEEDGEEEETQSTKSKKTTKKPKLRKWWVNKIKGRPLRMEFAEDSTVRYKKRYGKGGTTNQDTDAGQDVAVTSTNDMVAAKDVVIIDTQRHSKIKPSPKKKEVPQNTSYYGKKVDARNIKPGAALAGAQRLSSAIVESRGKKVTFD